MDDGEDGASGSPALLSKEVLGHLVLAALRWSRRGRRGSGDVRFATLWGEFLSRHATLKRRSEALPQRTLSSLAGAAPARLLYVMQHEWAVVPGPSEGGPDFIASDDATTCHIVAARNPETGAVGLCHLDHANRVNDLASFEAALAPTPPTTPIELYIVGGYREEQSEELSAAVLHYFHLSSGLPWLLRMARLSVGNTETLENGVLSPICRSFGLRCEDGSCFSGPLPPASRGPARALRAARIFSDQPQPLTRLPYNPVSQRVEVSAFPFSRSEWQWQLLQMDDRSLLENTSTSCEVEGPHYAHEMRETLRLLYDSRPDDHFVGTTGGASFDVPRMRLDDEVEQPAECGVVEEQGNNRAEGAGVSKAVEGGNNRGEARTRQSAGSAELKRC